VSVASALRIVLALVVALATVGARPAPSTTASGDGTRHLESSVLLWASPSGRPELQRWRVGGSQPRAERLTHLPWAEPVHLRCATASLEGARTDLFGFVAAVIWRDHPLERSRGPPA